MDVEQDLRLLTEDLVRTRLHIATAERRVLAPAKFKKGGESLPRKSAIIDCFYTGAQALNKGKFNDFIQSTTWDPAVGYPIDVIVQSSLQASDDVLLNGTIFDRTDKNPITQSEFNDIDDGDDHEKEVPGLGSLGGGMD